MGVVEAAIRKQHAHGALEFWITKAMLEHGGVRGAAKHFGVSYRSLYRWIAANGYTIKSTRVSYLEKVKDHDRQATAQRGVVEGGIREG